MLIRISILAVLVATNSVPAQTRCTVDDRPDEAATRFVISAGTVTLPLGAFLLVRKDNKVGAIRLTTIDKDTTELYGKSKYESFFQPNASEPMVGKSVVRITGEVDVLPSKGPGRGIYIYRPGVFAAKIGKWKFDFGRPTMMTMSDTSFWTGVGDHGYEFAPTSACNISDADVHDKRLKWFRFDRNASVTLLLSDLPR